MDRMDIGRRQYPRTEAVHVKEIVADSPAIRFISMYLQIEYGLIQKQRIFHNYNKYIKYSQLQIW